MPLSAQSREPTELSTFSGRFFQASCPYTKHSYAFRNPLHHSSSVLRMGFPWKGTRAGWFLSQSSPRCLVSRKISARSSSPTPDRTPSSLYSLWCRTFAGSSQPQSPGHPPSFLKDFDFRLTGIFSSIPHYYYCFKDHIKQWLSDITTETPRQRSVSNKLYHN